MRPDDAAFRKGREFLGCLHPGPIGYRRKKWHGNLLIGTVGLRSMEDRQEHVPGLDRKQRNLGSET